MSQSDMEAGADRKGKVSFFTTKRDVEKELDEIKEL